MALLFGVSVQLAFVLPGIAIARAVAGPALGWLIPLAFGPMLGQALASLALTGVWAAGGRGIWVVLSAPLLVAAIILPARRLQGRWRLPATTPGDRVALAALLMLAPFAEVRIVPERFPVKSRLHGGWKGLAFNTFFVGTFNALPRSWVRPLGWHLMAFCRKG